MITLITKPQKDYELIDSGLGEKLERFGTYILRRPDPEVLWYKHKTEEDWKNVDGHFIRTETGGKWKWKGEKDKTWSMDVLDTHIALKVQTFKHVGVFPEQLSSWQWMMEKINHEKEKRGTIKVLNLFGYTGVASVLLAKAGAEVTHVDSVQDTMDWVKENASLNGISNIRYITDDARKFVEKEIRRGMTYDAILMDPPVYGKGVKKVSKNSYWHLEDDLLPLLMQCQKLLSHNPLFVSVSGYASQYSHLAYANALSSVFSKGIIESGELAIEESGSGRLLPAGIFARVHYIKN